MSRAATAAGVVGVAIAVGAILGMTERNLPPPVNESAPALSGTAGLEVHVAGWVLSPGVVEVPEGSIVADVIESAGGLRPGAMVDRINLAAPVRSGDQVVVPGPDDAATSSGDGLISVNRASAAELEGLPGVGPVLAKRIVAFRDDHGPFQQVEDLLEVPGIGEAKLSSIRDLVRVP